jgi:hypothetical protein
MRRAGLEDGGRVGGLAGGGGGGGVTLWGPGGAGC